MQYRSHRELYILDYSIKILPSGILIKYKHGHIGLLLFFFHSAFLEATDMRWQSSGT